jgi:hypothetical protein
LKSGNKGYDAGLGAVEMGQLARSMGKNSGRSPAQKAGRR